MRALLFGNESDPRFAEVKKEVEAQGLHPLFRNPDYFKANELERAEKVWIGEEHLFATDIKAAFEAIQAEVTLLPAPAPVASKLNVTVEFLDLPEVKAMAQAWEDERKALTDLLAEKDAQISDLQAQLKNVDDDSPSKDALVEEAVALHVGPPSTLARWGTDRLTKEIAAAKAKASGSPQE
jgi:hypothetical protein